MSEFHTYLIDDGEKHWVSGLSEGQALLTHALASYDSLKSYLEWNADAKITQLDDDEILEVGDFDEPQSPQVILTCGEWADIKQGQLIATTCF